MKLLGRGERAQPPELDDLVDDRALEELDEDKFGHKAVVGELAALIQSTPTPANIALYGPWGSGKTGLGNLLRKQLANAPGVRFASFNALKYAENPLRRHFISQVAREFKIKDDEFTRGLYRETTESDLKLHGIWTLIGTAVLCWFGIAVLAIGFGLLTHALHPSSIPTEVRNSLTAVLPASFPTAAVIGVFAALLSQSLRFESKVAAPSGEEQFEELFNDLVQQVGAERLVVFIDELDRCAPDEVVSTLETLRTFLEVEGCIFVVAADQQVLEDALSRSLRQATPADTANPYYSAGTGYLDKIFHYQIYLPPLLARRLSAFALLLVEDRKGVWNQVDKADVVSILIPTHVQSPRRVKVLLNGYVQAYHLAERRRIEGFDLDLGGQAAALAKLVCLRIEFPLFARDLQLDPSLPELVLLAADDQGKPDHVDDNLWRRAVLYSQGRLPVDTLLTAPEVVSEPAAVGASQVEAASAEEVAAAEAGVEEELDEAGAEGMEEDAPPASRTTSVQRALGLQLLTYLHKTSHVGPIRRELIYLESLGQAFGLDPGLAEQLRATAVNGQVADVIDIIRKLQPGLHGSAIRLLIWEAQEAGVGIETANATSALIGAAEAVSEEVAREFASAIAGAILARELRYPMQASDLEKAYSIAVLSQDWQGSRLAEVVASREEAIGTPAVALRILAEPGHVPHARLAEMLATTVTNPSSSAAAAEALLAMPDEAAEDLVRTGRHRIRLLWQRAKGEEKAAPGFGESLAAALDILLDGRPALAQLLAAVFLDAADEQPVRDAVEERLNALGTATERDYNNALLQRAGIRNAGQWPAWLDKVDLAAVGPKELASHVDRLASSLWSNSRDEDHPLTTEAIGAAAKAVGRLAAVAAGDRTNLEKAMAEATPASLANDAAAPAAERDLQTTRAMVSAGIIGPARSADRLCAQLTATLVQALPAQPVNSPLVIYLSHAARWAGENASVDAASSADGAAAAAAWLPSPVKESIRIALARTTQAGGAGSPYTAAEMSQLMSAHGTAFDPAAEIWLGRLASTPQEVWTVVGEMARLSLRTPIARGLAQYSARIDTDARFDLVRPALMLDPLASAHPTFLNACRFNECDQERAAGMLIELLARCTRTEQRETILHYWEALKPGDAVRKKLTDEVMSPIAHSNKGGYDLALRYFDLMLPVPYRGGSAIQRAMGRPPRGDARRQRAEQLLRKAGLA